MGLTRLRLLLIFELYIYLFVKRQFLLLFYFILTVGLFLACIFHLSSLIVDLLFTLSNLYLIIMFYCDDDKALKLYFKIHNINNFLRHFVKLIILYILFIIQIIIFRFLGNDIIESNLIFFYTIFISSLFCIFILMYEIRKLLIKIFAVFVFAVILLYLFSRILSYTENIILLFSLVLITLLYSLIKIKYEVTSYF